MSKLRLEGKVALITGAASGIGAEAARLFADHGAKVVIADVQEELGRQVAAETGGDRARFCRCDVRDEKQVEEAVRFAVETYGGLDVLFSNAGMVPPSGSIMEMDLGEFDNAMAVNVRGVAATIKHAARTMVERKTKGSIICTISVAVAVAGMAPHGYTTSKHALLGLVKSACGELGAHGIRVNGVSPFGVATPLACKAFGLAPEEVEENCRAMSNLKGAVLSVRHVAEAALFLASDEAAYISGHNLVVDGGFTAVGHGGAPR